MVTCYLTFGQRYRTEPHPQLGARPELPDGWLTIEAEDVMEAARIAHMALGTAWASVSEQCQPEFYPAGHLGTLQQALAHHRG